ncbi:phosphatase PAP2 family protein [Pseudoxanthobacter sp.]|uniref:phosphatase PAP2 family protein n=1 Tax=Pseudoxanthobacter sp. TaxID=1925742 RepID=UPI002FE0FCB6
MSHPQHPQPADRHRSDRPAPRRLPALLSRLRAEPGLLAAFLAACGLFLTFAFIADHVMEREAFRFDPALLGALRQPGDPARLIGPGWLAEAARDVTALGSTVVLIMVLAIGVGYLWLSRRRTTALLLIAAVGGGQMLSSALKWLVDRPRPDVVPHLAEVSTASFPSGHSTLSAVAYLTIGALLAQAQRERRVRLFIMAVALLLTVMIGASRVLLGVHWPSDVVAGWALGAFWALACWMAARLMQQAGNR